MIKIQSTLELTMGSHKTYGKNAFQQSHAASARWVAEQAIFKLSEITPDSQAACAAILSEQLNQVTPKDKTTQESTMSYNELTDISRRFNKLS